MVEAVASERLHFPRETLLFSRKIAHHHSIYIVYFKPPPRHCKRYCVLPTLKAEHVDYLTERVRSGRMEGQNIAALEARLSTSISDLQRIVVDAARHYTCRVIVSDSTSTSTAGYGYGCGDAGGTSAGCWCEPVDISTSLIRSSVDGVIPFRLAMCLCAAVCLISYTAETELVTCKYEVGPASEQVDASIVIEVALDEATAQSVQRKSHSHSRKRKSLHTLDPSGCDNTVTSIDAKRGGRASPTANDGKALLTLHASRPHGHREGHGHGHGVTRNCRPDFFVQLDPGPFSLLHLQRLRLSLWRSSDARKLSVISLSPPPAIVHDSDDLCDIGTSCLFIYSSIHSSIDPFSHSAHNCLLCY